MPTDITTSTNDGWILENGTTSWSDVRDASTGVSSGRTSTNNFQGISAGYSSGRFGNTFTVIKVFF